MSALLILILAQTPDVERAATLLAPSPIDFDRLLGETAQMEDNAEAIGVALARVQNALAERWAATSTHADAAAQIEPLAELALEPVLLRDHRDAVQSLRASSDRLQRITEAPTVSPVVFGRRSARVKQLLQQTGELVRIHTEMFAWHERFVRPRLERLEVGPALVPGPGWPRRSPYASDDPSAHTAVVGIGGGLICPDRLPADGTTRLLTKEVACYGGPDCSCIAVPVFPGAVIGP